MSSQPLITPPHPQKPPMELEEKGIGEEQQLLGLVFLPYLFGLVFLPFSLELFDSSLWPHSKWQSFRSHF